MLIAVVPVVATNVNAPDRGLLSLPSHITHIAARVSRKSVGRGYRGRGPNYNKAHCRRGKDRAHWIIHVES